MYILEHKDKAFFNEFVEDVLSVLAFYGFMNLQIHTPNPCFELVARRAGA